MEIRLRERTGGRYRLKKYFNLVDEWYIFPLDTELRPNHLLLSCQSNVWQVKLSTILDGFYINKSVA